VAAGELMRRAGDRWKEVPVTTRRWTSGGGVLGCALLLMAFTIPRKAVVLPVGPEVALAFELLRNSPTGNELVRRIERSANGVYIYLSLGETERDELVDEWGRPVRGVTRAVTRVHRGTVTVSNVTIVTNRDLTAARPGEIVKSLAFELENIRYLYATGGHVLSGIDSPYAAAMQSQVVRELNL
jgi:hypothetical protein